MRATLPAKLLVITSKEFYNFIWWRGNKRRSLVFIPHLVDKVVQLLDGNEKRQCNCKTMKYQGCYYMVAELADLPGIKRLYQPMRSG